MKTITTLLINNNEKVLSSLKIYLKEHCKNITTIYTSDSLEDSEEVIKEKKPEIILINMSVVDYSTNLNLSEYFNNIHCEIIYFNTLNLEVKADVGLDKFNASENESQSNKLEIKDVKVAVKNLKSSVYGLSALELKQLVDLLDKAVVTLLNNSALNLEEIGQELLPSSKIIAIPSLDTIDLIGHQELLYLEADGNYTTFHISDSTTIISSRNLGSYEKQLDSLVFFRIHNKYIVNINKVKSINKSSGDYCEITNGKRLPIAKRRKVELYRFLNLI
jgi:two-component system LytT family response regulator